MLLYSGTALPTVVLWLAEISTVGTRWYVYLKFNSCRNQTRNEVAVRKYWEGGGRGWGRGKGAM